MPIIEYKCVKCKHTYDEFYTTFSNREQTEKDVECPKCKSKDKKPVIGKTSFQLKGKWFKQGY